MVVEIREEKINSLDVSVTSLMVDLLNFSQESRKISHFKESKWILYAATANRSDPNILILSAEK